MSLFKLKATKLRLETWERPMPLDPRQKQEMLILISALETSTPCDLCLHWNHGFCRYWKETVPAETLPNGCEKWEFIDATPF
jgi:hypothetical protein